MFMTRELYTLLYVLLNPLQIKLILSKSKVLIEAFEGKEIYNSSHWQFLCPRLFSPQADFVVR